MSEEKTYYELLYEEAGLTCQDMNIPEDKKKDICRMELQINYLKDKKNIKDLYGAAIWQCTEFLILILSFFIKPVKNLFSMVFIWISPVMDKFTAWFDSFSGITEKILRIFIWGFILPFLLSFVVYMVWSVLFICIIKPIKYRHNLKRAANMENECKALCE
jgi:hypothetical protein